MKKGISYVLGAFILCWTFLINTTGVYAAVTCDQEFYWKLRYGRQYEFGDDFYNTSTNTRFGLNKIDTAYKEQQDYNGDSSFPSFVWTDWIKNKDHILQPKDSGPVLKATSSYPIKYHPTKRDSKNLTLTYSASYYQSVNNGTWTGPKTHTECKYYEITWCGDGVVDADFAETCDPEDASKTGWGNGGCNTNTCQPINNPTCNGLTVTPDKGMNPLEVTATCTGYKVGTFKIDCGNGQEFTKNGTNAGTETFAATCKYTTGDRDFTPKCFINGMDPDTNNFPSCQKTVKVDNPVPNILVDKKDANVFDLDKNVGNDTQTVYKGSGATFEITVRNNGAESLKNITLSDPQEASCGTKAGTIVDLSGKRFTNVEGNEVSIIFGGLWTHTNDILEIWETFTYSCKTKNLTSGLTNEVVANGVGVISGKAVTDKDPTVVVVIEKPVPKISVDKRDDNAADLDGNKWGNDSQTVKVWSGAVFRITVENTGTETLKNLSLTDTQAATCATKAGTYVDFAAKTFKNGNDVVVNIAVSGNGNHIDALFQPGEIFTYVCSKTNTQTAYTNIVEVKGTGIESGTNVNDNDPTEVILSTNPAIQIIKEDANSNDLDGVQFNDTQTVVQGSSAVFHITVKNTGNEALKDLILTDVLAPACATKAGTKVDLSGKKFVNISGVNVIITPDGLGNHTDNIFQVGEEFTYTCEKGNTQNNYTNTVGVSGVGVNTWKPVNDDDTSPVIVNTPVYDLALRKVLSASNGTGSLKKGGMVSFDIRVFNQGNVDANNIEVTDYIPTGLILSDANWTQSGTLAKRTISKIEAGKSVLVTIRFTIAVNAPNSITNYAEISWDDGSDCDSTPDSTNGNQTGETGTGMINNDIGTGCNLGGDEDDHDPETIVLGTDIYDLALVKKLSSTTQGPFSSGSTVVFDIEVLNQGNVLASNIEVTDYIPTGLILNDSTWTQSGATAKQTISAISAGEKKTLTIQFKIAANPPASITNLAEISWDDGNDCDSTPDSIVGNDGTVIDNATGTGCEPGGDEDDHDPETIVIGTSRTDVYLIKSLAAGQPTVVNPGDRVHYVVTVVNSGSTVANNYTVEDHFPAGLILDDTNWTLVSGATRVARYNTVINNLAAGAQVKFDIYFKIASDVTGTVRNLAVVCKIAPGDLVCDPTPPPSCDDETEIGTPEGCVEVTVPNCLNLTATPASAVSSLTSELVCTGTGATSYKIEVKNSAGIVVQTLNSRSGSVTLGTIGNYTASCYINNRTTTPAVCEKPLSVTTPGSSSGWNPPSCNDIIKNGSGSYTCYGNNYTTQFAMKCGTEIKWPQISRDSDEPGSRMIADFTCAEGIIPVCYGAGPNATISQIDNPERWYTSSACTIQSNPTCGDGVINQTSEQCDMGTNNGKPGYACSGTCTAGGGSSGGSSGWSSSSSSSSGWIPDTPTCKRANGCTPTTPNGWELIFGPTGNIIVGHDKNILQEKGQEPYLYNKSDYDLSFDALCVKKTLGDASITELQECINIWNDIIYAHERIEMPSYYEFKSNKNAIPSGQAYGSGVITTSVKKGNTYYYNAYFAWDLNVRVAKPAVTTIGGGTTYVKDTNSKIGDLQKVTSGVTGYENNKNFVGTSVGETKISSYTKEVSSSGAVQKSQSDKTKYTSTLTGALKTTGTTIATFEKYNGLDNVFIIRGSNAIISNSFILPTTPTTYIIEWGNLTINRDIETSTNIAFVVKGGNIIIDKNVNKLSGTYISIPVSGVGGKILSNGDTDVQLVVTGSLYGDIAELVDARHYIAKSTSSSMLGVGTIVSFGSSIFHKPAPLVGQFIGEYLDTTKVAK